MAWNPHSCPFCGGEHRLGQPGYVPVCKLALAAERSRPSYLRSGSVLKEPVHERVLPEIEPGSAPGWYEEQAEALERRRRRLDEPIVVRKDRRLHNIKMRAYRLRKRMRGQGHSEAVIAVKVAEAERVWLNEVEGPEGTP